MPSSKDPKNITVGPGLAPEDSVGTQSLDFAVGGDVDAHASDPHDAHKASAISTYTDDPTANPFDDDNVQENLEELSAIIPEMNEIGMDPLDTGAPNTGIPVWGFDSGFRKVGGVDNAVNLDYGLGIGETVETYNILSLSDDMVVSGIVFPADRGTLGILRIDPDGAIHVRLGPNVRLERVTRHIAHAYKTHEVN